MQHWFIIQSRHYKPCCALITFLYQHLTLNHTFDLIWKCAFCWTQTLNATQSCILRLLSAIWNPRWLRGCSWVFLLYKHCFNSQTKDSGQLWLISANVAVKAKRITAQPLAKWFPAAALGSSLYKPSRKHRKTLFSGT